MKASQLIEKLQALVAKHGDLTVFEWPAEGCWWLEEKIYDPQVRCLSVCQPGELGAGQFRLCERTPIAMGVLI